MASEAETVDFVDRAHAYKGKTLTLEATLLFPHRAYSLREFVGSDEEVRCALWTSGVQSGFWVLLPEGLEVPNAADTDLVHVSFVCEQGDANQGNVATRVTRPHRR